MLKMFDMLLKREFLSKCDIRHLTPVRFNHFPSQPRCSSSHWASLFLSLLIFILTTSHVLSANVKSLLLPHTHTPWPTNPAISHPHVTRSLQLAVLYASARKQRTRPN